MNSNKKEAIKKLQVLRLHILESQDFMDYEVGAIEDIINFINKNL
jgi:uncharacterized protein YfkK (UPF0435 family)